MQEPISFVIKGSPQSKANSRRLVVNNKTGRMMFIKSKAAISYNDAFRMQCPKLDTLLEGDVCVTAHIYYGSRRPDLDESIVLDAMQGLIYSNDRQVKEKHIYWHLDPENPRAEITVTPIGR